MADILIPGKGLFRPVAQGRSIVPGEFLHLHNVVENNRFLMNQQGVIVPADSSVPLPDGSTMVCLEPAYYP